MLHYLTACNCDTGGLGTFRSAYPLQIARRKGKGVVAIEGQPQMASSKVATRIFRHGTGTGNGKYQESREYEALAEDTATSTCECGCGGMHCNALYEA